MDDEDALFAGEGRYARIHLHGSLEEDSPVWEHLTDVLVGIARRQPNTVFGLFGATPEEEIQQVAEYVASAGLRAIVWTPLCRPASAFSNLDEHAHEMTRHHMAGRVLGGKDWRPLDKILGFDEADDAEGDADDETE